MKQHINGNIFGVPNITSQSAASGQYDANSIHIKKSENKWPEFSLINPKLLQTLVVRNNAVNNWTTFSMSTSQITSQTGFVAGDTVRLLFRADDIGGYRSDFELDLIRLMSSERFTGGNNTGNSADGSLNSGFLNAGFLTTRGNLPFASVVDAGQWTTSVSTLLEAHNSSDSSFWFGIENLNNYTRWRSYGMTSSGGTGKIEDGQNSNYAPRLNFECTGGGVPNTSALITKEFDISNSYNLEFKYVCYSTSSSHVGQLNAFLVGGWS